MKMSCSAKWFTTLIKALRFSKSPWLAPFCVKVFTDNFFSSQLHCALSLCSTEGDEFANFCQLRARFCACKLEDFFRSLIDIFVNALCIDYPDRVLYYFICTVWTVRSAAPCRPSRGEAQRKNPQGRWFCFIDETEVISCPKFESSCPALATERNLSILKQK